MSSNIIHDHVYLSKFDREKPLNKTDNRRIIRKKCDIQTDEDQEEYSRRRSLNNASCRISRIYRQSKSNFIIKKCHEYEDLNTKLTLEKSILIQVIKQLKEHLRTLVPKTIKQN
jgi:hypothetical protein